MADDLPAQLAAEMARLRSAYLEHLTEDLATLTALTDDLGEEGRGRTVLEELHRRLHKLAGSSGTFGLSELSARSRRLEELSKDWLDGKTAGDVAWKSLVAGVKALIATATTPESRR